MGERHQQVIEVIVSVDKVVVCCLPGPVIHLSEGKIGDS